MIVRKITDGYVVQVYDTETKEWISQEFRAGDVEWTTQDGIPISCPDVQAYLPFEMKQPADIFS